MNDTQRKAKLQREQMWVVTENDVVCDCPKCGAHAIVTLPVWLRLQQPDHTTHVCHPGFGGCNHGFFLAEGR